jgi:hypothetical protein
MLSRFGYAPQLWPGFTPYEISKLLLDKHFIDRLAESKWPSSWWVSSMDDGLVWQTIFSVGSVLAYVTLAALLVWHTLHRFEIVAGRAQRASLPPPSSLKLPDPKTGTPATAQPEVAGARA